MIKLNSVIVSGVRTLADKSLRITLDSMELPAEEMTAIFKAYKEGNQGVKIAEIKTKDVKSKSKQLRNVLYLLHEKTAKTQSFEDFYNSYMDKVINHIKDQLN